MNATPDLTHVVLRSDVALTPQPSGPGIYDWAAGRLQLVSALPSGQPADEASGYLELGSGHGFSQANSYRHAISDDGARVVWTQTPQGGQEQTVSDSPRLFLSDTRHGRSVQLDTPAAGVNPTPGKVVFQIASADGSKVFFTDTEPLTPDAKASFQASGDVQRPDLYECEITEEPGGAPACKLRDLTAPASSAEGAAVQGVVGASEDGSYLYVVATGVLAPGARAGGENLYVLHNQGAAWSTRFIATLSREDAPDWGLATFAPKVVDPLTLSARVSPDGRYLAFMSNRRLTGYDNTDVNEEGGPHADEEVFLYDASSTGIACASCNPTGARPRGVLDRHESGEGIGLLVDRVGTWVEAGTDHWLAGSSPAARRRASRRPCVSRATCLTAGACSSPAPMLWYLRLPGRPVRRRSFPAPRPRPWGWRTSMSTSRRALAAARRLPGCVALISSGSSRKESALLDASTSGNDVFFITDSKLLPQDTDLSYDVYDARACTGAAPCQTPPPAPPGECADTPGCRPLVAPPQSFQPPLTASFVGPGSIPHLLAAGGTLAAKTTHKPLTRVQKLRRALRACRARPHRTSAQRTRRARCETHAKRLYRTKPRRAR